MPHLNRIFLRSFCMLIVVANPWIFFQYFNIDFPFVIVLEMCLDDLSLDANKSVQMYGCMMTFTLKRSNRLPPVSYLWCWQIRKTFRKWKCFASSIQFLNRLQVSSHITHNRRWILIVKHCATEIV